MAIRDRLYDMWGWFFFLGGEKWNREGSATER
jgi:hypothetical protein